MLYIITPFRWACFLATSVILFSSKADAAVTSEVRGAAQFFMDGNSAVAGVSDQEQALYQAQLAGLFSVRISGLEPGSYRVDVGNAELVGGGEDVSAFRNYRIFDIAANGTPVVEGLNLIEKFGYATKGDVSFQVEPKEGVIEINFLPRIGHGVPRMSFVRVYDKDGKLVAEEKASSRKPKNWTAPGSAIAYLPDVFKTFPKKDAAGTYPEMKIYDKDGNPWRAAREDWEGARTRVASNPAWAEWLVKERALVDNWMARHRDRTEWLAGWYHDFVSPKDGSFINWTEDVPREEVEFLKSVSDPKIEITPKIFGGWVFLFRHQHAVMMRRAAQLYRLTGEEKYATWAAGQLDFYADHFLDWPESARGDGSRLYWQTLDEATALSLYAETARLLGNYVTPERKTAWREKFFYPEVAILNARNAQMSNISGIHNIATWHRCIAAQVALLFGDEALWKEALDGEFGLRRQLSSGVTSDYIWWEQSFGYNSYLVEATLNLFQSAGVQGRASELANEMSIVENLMLAPVYLRFPDRSLPMPADITARISAPNNALFASAYRVFPTIVGLSLAKDKRNWDTLLDPPAPVASVPELPQVKSRNLESTRMAVLKSGPWQVFVHYGQLTSSHAQAELMNYSAFYNGIDVTHDPGTVGYGSPMHAGYYTRGLSHNVPLIDGEGANVFPQKGEITEFSENPPRISIHHPKYRTGTVADRTLEIDGKMLKDTVSVEVRDGKTHSLGMVLHLQGKVQLPDSFVADESFAVARPDSFSAWTGARKAEFSDKAEFDVTYGKTVLRLTILVPGPFTVWHASTPDSPPNRREGLYIESSGSNIVFQTILAPQ